jgi:plastocyanin
LSFVIGRGSARVRGWAVGVAVLALLTALVASPGPARADEPCGLSAAESTFLQHLKSAHFDRSPKQQAEDISNLDQYTVTHTELFGGMLLAALGGAGAAEDSFNKHFEAAHVQRSPKQQANDISSLDDYILIHTILFGGMGYSTLDCGGASAPPPAPAPAPDPAPAPAPDPAPAPEPAPAPAPAGPSAAVDIKDYAYMPKDLMVSRGTTVTWTNLDSDDHTVTSSTSSGPLKSATLKKGGTYSYTFTRSGTYNYYCALHPGMKASVMVH